MAIDQQEDWLLADGWNVSTHASEDQHERRIARSNRLRAEALKEGIGYMPMEGSNRWCYERSIRTMERSERGFIRINENDAVNEQEEEEHRESVPV